LRQLLNVSNGSLRLAAPRDQGYDNRRLGYDRLMWGKGRKERKWRAQFEHLGRERVSELVEIGAIPRARKRDAAVRASRSGPE